MAVHSGRQNSSFSVGSQEGKSRLLPRERTSSSLSSHTPDLARGRGGVPTARFGSKRPWAAFLLCRSAPASADQRLALAAQVLSTGVSTDAVDSGNPKGAPLAQLAFW